MAEYSTPEERTEMPTDKRMGQLRKEGALAISSDLVMVISLSTGFLALQLTWGWILHNTKIILVAAFGIIRQTDPLTTVEVMARFRQVVVLMAPPLLVIILMVAVASSLSVMLQTNWNIKGKMIDIRFSYLNPISGIRRIFSIQGFVSTLKAIAKLALVLPVAYFALEKQVPYIIQLIDMNVSQIMFFTGAVISTLFWKILYILVALAIFDFFWSRFQWLRQNKMTKEEVKDERKAVEGDETTKRKIQAKGLMRVIQRIRQSVPQADVVVTNPTHYAVALQYDRKTMSAPRVVAKGKDHLAEKIKEIARESGVPVLERKFLARALYSSVEVGREIPSELFRAAAEVLAYVFRLRNPWGYMKQHSGG